MDEGYGDDYMDYGAEREDWEGGEEDVHGHTALADNNKDAATALRRSGCCVFFRNIIVITYKKYRIGRKKRDVVS